MSGLKVPKRRWLMRTCGSRGGTRPAIAAPTPASPTSRQRIARIAHTSTRAATTTMFAGRTATPAAAKKKERKIWISGARGRSCAGAFQASATLARISAAESRSESGSAVWRSRIGLRAPRTYAAAPSRGESKTAASLRPTYAQAASHATHCTAKTMRRSSSCGTARNPATAARKSGYPYVRMSVGHASSPCVRMISAR